MDDSQLGARACGRRQTRLGHHPPQAYWAGTTLAREQRNLAGILAADVAGCSRLMGRDESGTLARLAEVSLEIVAA